jgi:hypothetical protein
MMNAEGYAYLSQALLECSENDITVSWDHDLCLFTGDAIGRAFHVIIPDSVRGEWNGICSIRICKVSCNYCLL